MRMCFSIVSVLEVSTITLSGFHASPIDRIVPQRRVIRGRVFRHVRFERDARALEKDHAVRAVVQRGVAIVGVVEAREVFGDADRVDAGGDVFEDARIPDALLALAVRAVVIQVGELADERALSDTGTADDGYAHAAILVLRASDRHSGYRALHALTRPATCRCGAPRRPCSGRRSRRRRRWCSWFARG